MNTWILLLVLASATFSVASPYSFTLDGEPFDAKILPVTGERLGNPSPGDVGFLDDIPFVLRKPGHYQFHSEDQSRYYLKIDDSAETVAVVRSKPGAPIPDLRDGDARHPPLAGLALQAPATLPEDALHAPSWTQTALRIETSSETEALPSLPAGLRYLVIDGTASAHLERLDSLGDLRDLRFLDLHLHENTEVSLSALARLPGLCNLNIRGGTVTETEQASLESARFLKLRSLNGLESVAFAAHSPLLRVFKVDETNVRDLRPLAGLEHLRLLSANATKVENLPPLSSLPALRDLRLHSTPVAKNDDLIATLRPRVNVLVKDWEAALLAFEEQEQRQPAPENPVLFLGSSSIRTWDLASAFPDRPTLNRGFGGSELSDAVRYFDRVVLPHRPPFIVLYAGDNDINEGETPAQVVADYKAFAAKVRGNLPQTHFAFLSIKPSPKRWEKWPAMKEANQAIRDLASADPYLHYLDAATPLLGADGRPNPKLFIGDDLHLTKAGYRLWNKIIEAWLQSCAPAAGK